MDVTFTSRLAFTLCFTLARLTGEAAAALARAYRALAGSSDGYGALVVVVVQLPLLLAWLPLRAVFLLANTACFALARA